MTNDQDREGAEDDSSRERAADEKPWEQGEALMASRLGDHLEATLTAICGTCGHVGHRKIADFAQLDGNDSTLGELVARLTCTFDKPANLPACVELTDGGVTKTVYSETWDGLISAPVPKRGR